MTRRPRTFTFYSYKGGVGRSMALLNVAWTLHSMGRHVLIVDLDLEAPGVSGFLRRNDELAPHPADQPDVVDLLRDAVPLARGQLGGASRPDVPLLATYLREVKPEKFAKSQNPRFRRTRLDVLCASDERDYTNRLAALDVASLSAEDLAETGNVLRELFFRHQFPWAWREGEENQPSCYDYILIDSRTGFTETSGLCIGPLADRLVIFCGLNDQNINGTAEFLKVVGLKPGPRSEPWDDADDIGDSSRIRGLGDKPSLLVASPVPAGDMEMKEERFQEMERILKVRPDHSISYHSRLSLFETVFLRKFPREIIAREYRDLTDSILSFVGDHPRQHQEKIRPLQTRRREGEVTDRFSLLRYAAMLDEQGAAPLRHVADQLADRAAASTGHEADTLFASAHDSYRAVLAVKPDDHEALYNWGTSFADQAKKKTGGEADALFAAAGERYQAALAIKPDFSEALVNWGLTLAEQAKQSMGREGDALFAAAEKKFQAALAIRPDDHDAFNNWGVMLAEQARQKTGGEADPLFAAAEQKFETALAIKPDNHEALNNWGIALHAKAQLKTDREADALCAAAGEKYQAALVIKPDRHETLNNWGIALATRAKGTAGEQADALFAAAGEKFQAALAIKPDKHEALHNWGSVLANQAQQKTGGEADALFAAAREKYQAALVLKPDDHSATYHLACVAALQKNTVEAMEWLQKAVQAGSSVTREKLAKDTDFDLIRGAPEFTEFLAKLPA